MRRVHWGRVILCGLMTGIVWHLLSAAFLAFAGGELLDVVEGGRRYEPRGGLFFFSMDVAMGIWAMWLFAVIRQRFRSRQRTAVVTGFAWWLLKSLQSAKWVSVGFVPVSVILAPMVATLLAVIIAVTVGAWAYEE